MSGSPSGGSKKTEITIQVRLSAKDFTDGSAPAKIQKTLDQWAAAGHNVTKANVLVAESTGAVAHAAAHGSEATRRQIDSFAILGGSLGNIAGRMYYLRDALFSLNREFSHLGRVRGLFAMAFAGLQSAVIPIGIDVVHDSIQAASRAQVATDQMRNAYKDMHRAENWGAMDKHAQDWIETGRNKKGQLISDQFANLGVDKSDLTSSVARLVRSGLNDSVIYGSDPRSGESRLVELQNAASAAKMSLPDFVDKVTKGQRGLAFGLRDLGITQRRGALAAITESTNPNTRLVRMLDILGARYEGAATVQSHTFAGAMTALKKSLDNLYAAIGVIIIPALTGLAITLTNAVQGINHWVTMIKDGGLVKWLQHLNPLVKGIGSLLAAFLGFSLLMRGVLLTRWLVRGVTTPLHRGPAVLGDAWKMTGRANEAVGDSIARAIDRMVLRKVPPIPTVDATGKPVMSYSKWRRVKWSTYTPPPGVTVGGTPAVPPGTSPPGTPSSGTPASSTTSAATLKVSGTGSSSPARLRALIDLALEIEKLVQPIAKEASLKFTLDSKGVDSAHKFASAAAIIPSIAALPAVTDRVVDLKITSVVTANTTAGVLANYVKILPELAAISEEHILRDVEFNFRTQLPPATLPRDVMTYARLLPTLQSMPADITRKADFTFTGTITSTHLADEVKAFSAAALALSRIKQDAITKEVDFTLAAHLPKTPLADVLAAVDVAARVQNEITDPLTVRTVHLVFQTTPDPFPNPADIGRLITHFRAIAGLPAASVRSVSLLLDKTSAGAADVQAVIDAMSGKTVVIDLAIDPDRLLSGLEKIEARLLALDTRTIKIGIDPAPALRALIALQASWTGMYGKFSTIVTFDAAEASAHKEAYIANLEKLFTWTSKDYVTRMRFEGDEGVRGMRSFSDAIEIVEEGLAGATTSAHNLSRVPLESGLHTATPAQFSSDPRVRFAPLSPEALASGEAPRGGQRYYTLEDAARLAGIGTHGETGAQTHAGTGGGVSTPVYIASEANASRQDVLAALRRTSLSREPTLSPAEWAQLLGHAVNGPEAAERNSALLHSMDGGWEQLVRVPRVYGELRDSGFTGLAGRDQHGGFVQPFLESQVHTQADFSAASRQAQAEALLGKTCDKTPFNPRIEITNGASNPDDARAVAREMPALQGAVDSMPLAARAYLQAASVDLLLHPESSAQVQPTVHRERPALGTWSGEAEGRSAHLFKVGHARTGVGTPGEAALEELYHALDWKIGAQNKIALSPEQGAQYLAAGGTPDAWGRIVGSQIGTGEDNQLSNRSYVHDLFMSLRTAGDQQEQAGGGRTLGFRHPGTGERLSMGFYPQSSPAEFLAWSMVQRTTQPDLLRGALPQVYEMTSRVLGEIEQALPTHIREQVRASGSASTSGSSAKLVDLTPAQALSRIKNLGGIAVVEQKERLGVAAGAPGAGQDGLLGMNAANFVSALDNEGGLPVQEPHPGEGGALFGARDEDKGSVILAGPEGSSATGEWSPAKAQAAERLQTLLVERHQQQQQEHSAAPGVIMLGPSGSTGTTAATLRTARDTPQQAVVPRQGPLVEAVNARIGEMIAQSAQQIRKQQRSKNPPTRPELSEAGQRLFEEMEPVLADEAQRQDEITRFYGGEEIAPTALAQSFFPQGYVPTTKLGHVLPDNSAQRPLRPEDIQATLDYWNRGPEESRTRALRTYPAYQGIARWLSELTGMHEDRTAAALALASPGNPWGTGGANDAVRIAYDALVDKNFHHWQPKTNQKLKDLVAGAPLHEVVTGKKVFDIYKAITGMARGQATPTGRAHGQGTAIDRNIMHAYGYNMGKSDVPMGDYTYLSRLLTETARILNIPPEALQAKVWEEYRSNEGMRRTIANYAASHSGPLGKLVSEALQLETAIGHRTRTAHDAPLAEIDRMESLGLSLPLQGVTSEEWARQPQAMFTWQPEEGKPGHPSGLGLYTSDIGPALADLKRAGHGRVEPVLMRDPDRWDELEADVASSDDVRTAAMELSGLDRRGGVIPGEYGTVGPALRNSLGDALLEMAHPKPRMQAGAALRAVLEHPVLAQHLQAHGYTALAGDIPLGGGVYTDAAISFVPERDFTTRQQIVAQALEDGRTVPRHVAQHYPTLLAAYPTQITEELPSSTRPAHEQHPLQFMHRPGVEYHGRLAESEAFSDDRLAWFTPDQKIARNYATRAIGEGPRSVPRLVSALLDGPVYGGLPELKEAIRRSGVTPADVKSSKIIPYSGRNLVDWLYHPQVRREFEGMGFTGYRGPNHTWLPEREQWPTTVVWKKAHVQTHEALIESALRAGEAISQEILRFYPDLEKLASQLERLRTGTGGIEGLLAVLAGTGGMHWTQAAKAAGLTHEEAIEKISLAQTAGHVTGDAAGFVYLAEGQEKRPRTAHDAIDLGAGRLVEIIHAYGELLGHLPTVLGEMDAHDRRQATQYPAAQYTVPELVRLAGGTPEQIGQAQAQGLRYNPQANVIEGEIVGRPRTAHDTPVSEMQWTPEAARYHEMTPQEFSTLPGQMWQWVPQGQTAEQAIPQYYAAHEGAEGMAYDNQTRTWGQGHAVARLVSVHNPAQSSDVANAIADLFNAKYKKHDPTFPWDDIEHLQDGLRDWHGQGFQSFGEALELAGTHPLVQPLLEQRGFDGLGEGTFVTTPLIPFNRARQVIAHEEQIAQAVAAGQPIPRRVAEAFPELTAAAQIIEAPSLRERALHELLPQELLLHPDVVFHGRNAEHEEFAPGAMAWFTNDLSRARSYSHGWANREDTDEDNRRIVPARIGGPGSGVRFGGLDALRDAIDLSDVGKHEIAQFSNYQGNNLVDWLYHPKVREEFENLGFNAYQGPNHTFLPEARQWPTTVVWHPEHIQTHEALVESALRAGEAVRAEILRFYPELEKLASQLARLRAGAGGVEDLIAGEIVERPRTAHDTPEGTPPVSEEQVAQDRTWHVPLRLAPPPVPRDRAIVQRTLSALLRVSPQSASTFLFKPGVGVWTKAPGDTPTLTSMRARDLLDRINDHFNSTVPASIRTLLNAAGVRAWVHDARLDTVFPSLANQVAGGFYTTQHREGHVFEAALLHDALRGRAPDVKDLTAQGTAHHEIAGHALDHALRLWTEGGPLAERTFTPDWLLQELDTTMGMGTRGGRSPFLARFRSAHAPIASILSKGTAHDLDYFSEQGDHRQNYYAGSPWEMFAEAMSYRGGTPDEQELYLGKMFKLAEVLEAEIDRLSLDVAALTKLANAHRAVPLTERNPEELSVPEYGAQLIARIEALRSAGHLSEAQARLFTHNARLRIDETDGPEKPRRQSLDILRKLIDARDPSVHIAPVPVRLPIAPPTEWERGKDQDRPRSHHDTPEGLEGMREPGARYALQPDALRRNIARLAVRPGGDLLHVAEGHLVAPELVQALQDKLNMLVPSELRLLLNAAGVETQVHGITGITAGAGNAQGDYSPWLGKARIFGAHRTGRSDLPREILQTALHEVAGHALDHALRLYTDTGPRAVQLDWLRQETLARQITGHITGQDAHALLNVMRSTHPAISGLLLPARQEQYFAKGHSFKEWGNASYYTDSPWEMFAQGMAYRFGSPTRQKRLRQDMPALSHVLDTEVGTAIQEIAQQSTAARRLASPDRGPGTREARATDRYFLGWPAQDTQGQVIEGELVEGPTRERSHHDAVEGASGGPGWLERALRAMAANEPEAITPGAHGGAAGTVHFKAADILAGPPGTQAHEISAALLTIESLLAPHIGTREVEGVGAGYEALGIGVGSDLALRLEHDHDKLGFAPLVTKGNPLINEPTLRGVASPLRFQLSPMLHGFGTADPHQIAKLASRLVREYGIEFYDHHNYNAAYNPAGELVVSDLGSVRPIQAYHQSVQEWGAPYTDAHHAPTQALVRRLTAGGHLEHILPKHAALQAEEADLHAAIDHLFGSGAAIGRQEFEALHDRVQSIIVDNQAPHTEKMAALAAMRPGLEVLGQRGPQFRRENIEARIRDMIVHLHARGKIDQEGAAHFGFALDDALGTRGRDNQQRYRDLQELEREVNRRNFIDTPAHLRTPAPPAPTARTLPMPKLPKTFPAPWVAATEQPRWRGSGGGIPLEHPSAALAVLAGAGGVMHGNIAAALEGLLARMRLLDAQLMVGIGAMQLFVRELQAVAIALRLLSNTELLGGRDHTQFFRDFVADADKGVFAPTAAPQPPHQAPQDIIEGELVGGPTRERSRHDAMEADQPGWLGRALVALSERNPKMFARGTDSFDEREMAFSAQELIHEATGKEMGIASTPRLLAKIEAAFASIEQALAPHIARTSVEALGAGTEALALGVGQQYALRLQPNRDVIGYPEFRTFGNPLVNEPLARGTSSGLRFQLSEKLTDVGLIPRIELRKLIDTLHDQYRIDFFDASKANTGFQKSTGRWVVLDPGSLKALTTLVRVRDMWTEQAPPTKLLAAPQIRALLGPPREPRGERPRTAMDAIEAQEPGLPPLRRQSANSLRQRVAAQAALPAGDLYQFGMGYDLRHPIGHPNRDTGERLQASFNARVPREIRLLLNAAGIKTGVHAAPMITADPAMAMRYPSSTGALGAFQWDPRMAHVFNARPNLLERLLPTVLRRHVMDRRLLRTALHEVAGHGLDDALGQMDQYQPDVRGLSPAQIPIRVPVRSAATRLRGIVPIAIRDQYFEPGPLATGFGLGTTHYYRGSHTEMFAEGMARLLGSPQQQRHLAEHMPVLDRALRHEVEALRVVIRLLTLTAQHTIPIVSEKEPTVQAGGAIEGTYTVREGSTRVQQQTATSDLRSVLQELRAQGALTPNAESYIPDMAGSILNWEKFNNYAGLAAVEQHIAPLRHAPYTPIGSGGHALALSLGGGAVLRLEPGVFEAPAPTHESVGAGHPLINQPLLAGMVGDLRYHVMPLATGVGTATPAILDMLQRELAKGGIDFWDKKPENVGFFGDQAKVIDPDAVRKLQTALVGASQRAETWAQAMAIESGPTISEYKGQRPNWRGVGGKGPSAITPEATAAVRAEIAPTLAQIPKEARAFMERYGVQLLVHSEPSEVARLHHSFEDAGIQGLHLDGTKQAHLFSATDAAFHEGATDLAGRPLPGLARTSLEELYHTLDDGLGTVMQQPARSWIDKEGQGYGHAKGFRSSMPDVMEPFLRYHISGGLPQGMTKEMMHALVGAGVPRETLQIPQYYTKDHTEFLAWSMMQHQFTPELLAKHFPDISQMVQGVLADAGKHAEALGQTGQYGGGLLAPAGIIQQEASLSRTGPGGTLTPEERTAQIEKIRKAQKLAVDPGLQPGERRVHSERIARMIARDRFTPEELAEPIKKIPTTPTELRQDAEEKVAHAQAEFDRVQGLYDQMQATNPLKADLGQHRDMLKKNLDDAQLAHTHAQAYETYDKEQARTAPYRAARAAEQNYAQAQAQYEATQAQFDQSRPGDAGHATLAAELKARKDALERASETVDRTRAASAAARQAEQAAQAAARAAPGATPGAAPGAAPGATPGAAAAAKAGAAAGAATHAAGQTVRPKFDPMVAIREGIWPYLKELERLNPWRIVHTLASFDFTGSGAQDMLDFWIHQLQRVPDFVQTKGLFIARSMAELREWMRGIGEWKDKTLAATGITKLAANALARLKEFTDAVAALRTKVKDEIWAVAGAKVEDAKKALRELGAWIVAQPALKKALIIGTDALGKARRAFDGLRTYLGSAAAALKTMPIAIGLAMTASDIKARVVELYGAARTKLGALSTSEPLKILVSAIADAKLNAAGIYKDINTKIASYAASINKTAHRGAAVIEIAVTPLVRAGAFIARVQRDINAYVARATGRAGKGTGSKGVVPVDPNALKVAVAGQISQVNMDALAAQVTRPGFWARHPIKVGAIITSLMMHGHNLLQSAGGQFQMMASMALGDAATQPVINALNGIFGLFGGVFGKGGKPEPNKMAHVVVDDVHNVFGKKGPIKVEHRQPVSVSEVHMGALTGTATSQGKDKALNVRVINQPAGPDVASMTPEQQRAYVGPLGVNPDIAAYGRAQAAHNVWYEKTYLPEEEVFRTKYNADPHNLDPITHQLLLGHTFDPTTDPAFQKYLRTHQDPFGPLYGSKHLGSSYDPRAVADLSHLYFEGRGWWGGNAHQQDPTYQKQQYNLMWERQVAWQQQYQVAFDKPNIAGWLKTHPQPYDTYAAAHPYADIPNPYASETDIWGPMGKGGTSAAYKAAVQGNATYNAAYDDQLQKLQSTSALHGITAGSASVTQEQIDATMKKWAAANPNTWKVYLQAHPGAELPHEDSLVEKLLHGIGGLLVKVGPTLAAGAPTLEYLGVQALMFAVAEQAIGGVWSLIKLFPGLAKVPGLGKLLESAKGKTPQQIEQDAANTIKEAADTTTANLNSEAEIAKTNAQTAENMKQAGLNMKNAADGTGPVTPDLPAAKAEVLNARQAALDALKNPDTTGLTQNATRERVASAVKRFQAAGGNLAELQAELAAQTADSTSAIADNTKLALTQGDANTQALIQANEAQTNRIVAEIQAQPQAPPPGNPNNLKLDDRGNVDTSKLPKNPSGKALDDANVQYARTDPTPGGGSITREWNVKGQLIKVVQTDSQGRSVTTDYSKGGTGTITTPGTSVDWKTPYKTLTTAEQNLHNAYDDEVRAPSPAHKAALGRAQTAYNEAWGAANDAAQQARAANTAAGNTTKVPDPTRDSNVSKWLTDPPAAAAPPAPHGKVLTGAPKTFASASQADLAASIVDVDAKRTKLTTKITGLTARVKAGDGSARPELIQAESALSTLEVRRAQLKVALATAQGGGTEAARVTAVRDTVLAEAHPGSTIPESRLREMAMPGASDAEWAQLVKDLQAKGYIGGSVRLATGVSGFEVGKGSWHTPGSAQGQSPRTDTQRLIDLTDQSATQNRTGTTDAGMLLGEEGDVGLAADLKSAGAATLPMLGLIVASGLVGSYQAYKKSNPAGDVISFLTGGGKGSPNLYYDTKTGHLYDVPAGEKPGANMTKVGWGGVLNQNLTYHDKHGKQQNVPDYAFTGFHTSVNDRLHKLYKGRYDSSTGVGLSYGVHTGLLQQGPLVGYSVLPLDQDPWAKQFFANNGSSGHYDRAKMLQAYSHFIQPYMIDDTGHLLPQYQKQLGLDANGRPLQGAASPYVHLSTTQSHDAASRWSSAVGGRVSTVPANYGGVKISELNKPAGQYFSLASVVREQQVPSDMANLLYLAEKTAESNQITDPFRYDTSASVASNYTRLQAWLDLPRHKALVAQTAANMPMPAAARPLPPHAAQPSVPHLLSSGGAIPASVKVGGSQQPGWPYDSATLNTKTPAGAAIMRAVYAQSRASGISPSVFLGVMGHESRFKNEVQPGVDQYHTGYGLFQFTATTNDERDYFDRLFGTKVGTWDWTAAAMDPAKAIKAFTTFLIKEKHYDPKHPETLAAALQNYAGIGNPSGPSLYQWVTSAAAGGGHISASAPSVPHVVPVRHIVPPKKKASLFAVDAQPDWAKLSGKGFVNLTNAAIARFYGITHHRPTDQVNITGGRGAGAHMNIDQFIRTHALRDTSAHRAEASELGDAFAWATRISSDMHLGTGGFSLRPGSSLKNAVGDLQSWIDKHRDKIIAWMRAHPSPATGSTSGGTLGGGGFSPYYGTALTGLDIGAVAQAGMSQTGTIDTSGTATTRVPGVPFIVTSQPHIGRTPAPTHGPGAAGMAHLVVGHLPMAGILGHFGTQAAAHVTHQRVIANVHQRTQNAGTVTCACTCTEKSKPSVVNKTTNVHIQNIDLPGVTDGESFIAELEDFVGGALHARFGAGIK